jgi:ADP-heptose:LPS heptosyltransferase
MPRRLRRPKTRARSLRLDDLSLYDLLCFQAAWKPPSCAADRSSSRWLTWDEFLTEYQQIREELRAAFPDHGEPDFAEQVLTFATRHGIHALESLSYDELRARIMEAR